MIIVMLLIVGMCTHLLLALELQLGCCDRVGFVLKPTPPGTTPLQPNIGFPKPETQGSKSPNAGSLFVDFIRLNVGTMMEDMLPHPEPQEECNSCDFEGLRW